jgi:thiamine biosynthesis lipoprotein
MTKIAAGIALTPLAFVVASGTAQSATDRSGLFIDQRENVLGTSFDLKVVARSFDAAQQAESVILTEIDRLTSLLSGYDASSEFSRWEQTVGQAIAVSPELWSVLNAFDTWSAQTGGAISAASEVITHLWQRAAQLQTIPDDADRLQAVAAARQTHWQLDATTQTATRLSQTPLRLNTFTKSYILDQAATRAMQLPGVEGLVLNSGGDLVIRGDWQELVKVANPGAFAENGQPITHLAIADRAVATSGNYKRGLTIDGTRYSHIMDPQTGWPARDIASATVVHPDPVTAGALATAFNVLSPAESAQLAARLPGTDYLLITRAGDQISSPTWSDLVAPSAIPGNQPDKTARLLTVAAQKDKLWNANQELLINIELNAFPGRSHRPFVAVWVEDQHHEPVRNLALWYNKPRWLPELRAFYALQREENLDVSSITSATRSPGAYTIQWDGKDNAGQYVKQGNYTICIETAREHGTYQLIRQAMDFNGKPKQQTLTGNVEVTTAALDYREKAGSR